MDWGPDGWLYGPLWNKGQVARVNVDTGEIKVVAEGLVVPAAVKFDAQGRLHVLEFADRQGRPDQPPDREPRGISAVDAGPG